MAKRNRPIAMVSTVWSRLLFGHDCDTSMNWLFVGSLVCIYSVFVVISVFLDALGF